ncbi:MAG: hypothetical protein QXK64_03195 [Candidatus Woesearchaeota archaeon]
MGLDWDWSENWLLIVNWTTREKYLYDRSGNDRREHRLDCLRKKNIEHCLVLR